MRLAANHVADEKLSIDTDNVVRLRTFGLFWDKIADPGASSRRMVDVAYHARPGRWNPTGRRVDGSTELYDIQADPGETDDISDE